MGNPRNAVSLQFVNLTVSMTPWIWDQAATATIYTVQHRHRINADRHRRLEWDSNPRPVSEWAKTFHALNGAATVIGTPVSAQQLFNKLSKCVHQYIVTCRLVQATKMTGSSSDDWIY
jgi:hypothetical protein